MAIAVSSCCDATLLLDVGALGIFQKRREFHRPSVNEDSWFHGAERSECASRRKLSSLDRKGGRVYTL